jgi:hypothetical protein
MDIVADLQRRCAREKMGSPIYDFVTTPDSNDGVCRVYVGARRFVAIYSGSKKRGRRNAASLAMFAVFGVYTAIIISDKNPQVPYVHFIPKKDYLTDEHQNTLLNSLCRILVVGETGLIAGQRVSCYTNLEAAVRELTC